MARRVVLLPDRRGRPDGRGRAHGMAQALRRRALWPDRYPDRDLGALGIGAGLLAAVRAGLLAGGDRAWGPVGPACAAQGPTAWAGDGHNRPGCGDGTRHLGDSARLPV